MTGEREAPHAEKQEAARLVCGCGCPTCVDVIYEMSELGMAWSAVNSPCRTAEVPHG